ncbi:MAG: hypothetical protein D8H99_51855 [Streptococcus sp.]|nr:MAG: hypothetical protein D8H99_51855 [Streptococcus sp.]
MIEKLLSYPHFLATLFLIVLMIALVLFVVFVKYKEMDADKALKIVGIFLGLTFGGSLYISDNVQRTYVSDYTWKQIYTNDVNADVTLKQIEFLSETHDIKVGKPLDCYERLFDNIKKHNEQPLFEITVKNDNETVTKTAQLTQVISDGEITKNSKIVKIEYRPVKGYYQKLWSFTGDLIDAPKDSAEIRVTIQNESKSELNNLFEPTK